MNVPFPPPPPIDTDVIAARWVLSAIVVVAAAGLLFRTWRWKTMRDSEIVVWLLMGIGALALAPFGYSSQTLWNNNGPLYSLVASVSVLSGAGAMLCAAKAIQLGRLWPTRVMQGGGVLLLLFIVGTFFLPSVRRAREASKRTQCKNNLKQIGLALHNYEMEFDCFPSALGGDHPVSWRIKVLPYIDQRERADRYSSDRNWDEAPNHKLASESVPAFACPSNYWPKDFQGRYFTGYSMPVGSHTVGAKSGLKMREITDGTSNTFMVVEACGAEIVWTQPQDVDFDTRPAGVNQSGDSPGASAGWLSSYHTGGAHLLLADGSTRFISSNIDPKVLKSLATIDGGETVGDFD